MLQNLKAGWRPVSASYLPKKAPIPWHGEFAAPVEAASSDAVPQACAEEVIVAEVEPEPIPVDFKRLSNMRGWSGMAEITASFEFNPEVRQVVGRPVLVHLYCEDVAPGVSLCNPWRCGRLTCPVKGASFSEKANEFDMSGIYGFCELCYTQTVASRIGTPKTSTSRHLKSSG